MKAILLAAGLGSRLGQITQNQPKAVVAVASRPLVQRAIGFARLAGAEEIVVVGGFNSHCLWEILVDESVTRLENPRYRHGNLYSLAVAREYLRQDFLLMNIDHLYPTHLARMIGETGEGVWAVCDFDRPLYADDMKVRITGDILESAWLSAIGKDLDDYDGGYCGMTVVRGRGCHAYGTAFDTVLGHRREQAVVEDVHGELILQGDPSRVLDISGIRWLEIDTQEDLINAERIMRMKPHFLD